MAALRDSVAHATELLQQGRLPEARAVLGAFLAQSPGHAQALHLAGTVELMSGSPAAAVPLLRRCVQAAPGASFAWSNLGVACNANHDFTQALEAFRKALELDPRSVPTMKNMGIALRGLKRHEEAMATLRRAAQREPNDPGIHREVGDLLVEMGRPGEALARYDRALSLDPSDATGWHHRGVAALRAGDAARAEQDLRRALSISPGNAFVHNEVGVVLEALGRREDGIAAYTRAIEIDPRFVEAMENRAAALAGAGRYAEALEDYERVESQAPGRPYVAGHRMQAKLAICDWAGFDDLVASIVEAIDAGRPAAQPFPLCYVDVPAATRRRCAGMYAANFVPPVPEATRNRAAGKRARLRVGYFSADFRDHPVGQLMAPLVEAHDRARVETFAFSWGASTEDATRGRLRQAFEHFEDASAMGTEAIVALARERELDVAIDLMGHTSGSRLEVFAHRVASVQAHFLGYPGTIAASGIDYLVADPVVVPEPRFGDYAEKVAWVAGTALAAERTRIESATPARAALGLPEDAFVFGCFSQRAKITPGVFVAWMRVLSRVEGSVLWLADPGEAAVRNLRAEATRHSIDPARLAFAPRVPAFSDHLARLGVADLFLDTFPYGGHVTASDALQAGVPLLACAGEAFASRVGASLLHSLGLDELVTGSLADYEALAVALALDRPRLVTLRERLRANLAGAAAFDPAALARSLEALYERMAERARAGLAPEHLAP